VDNKIDAVLLDDDFIIRMHWETKAKEKKLNLLSFDLYSDLMTNLPRIGKSVKIFLDSELGDNKKGQDIAKELFKLGYTELYLVTGHHPDLFKAITCIKGVYGKEFPL
jgi:hypothetical protein